MKKAYLFFLAFAALVYSAAARGQPRCKRAVGRCTNENGTVVLYETCTQICCGKVVYDKYDAFTDCCGDRNFGVLYNPETEICCSWPPTLDYTIHNRTENSPTEPQCCGADLFEEENPHIQCCRSWNLKPQTFNTLDSMCCEGRVGFITTTAYSNCCFDVPYDRRFSSCPCYNGKLLKATQKEGACCKFDSERTNWNPYIKETQGCCDGEIYDLESQICCNGIIANASSDYCCNGLLTPTDPSQAGNVNLGCCNVAGTDVVYDSTEQTCCDNELYDATTEGDECCSNQPYFSDSGNCCNNTVFDLFTEGAGCCAGSPYDESSGVCCGGGVVGSEMKYAACCGTQSFDAYEQTCCGNTVYDNPLDERGVTSHHTRCCGDFGDPSTLYPYDYDIETCCNGVNASLFGEDGKKIDQNDLECCGESAMNRLSYLCCDNVVNENPYKEYGRCWGNFTYDIRVEIYCEGVRLEHNFGEDAICCGAAVFNGQEFADTECCGDTSMDADSFKCCDGETRPLNGIPKHKAVCCGDACIDGRDYWCCEGKAYWKGENNEDVGELVDGLACDEFFKQSVLDRRARLGPGVIIDGKISFGGARGSGTPSPATRRTRATTTTATTTTEAATTPAPARPRPRRPGPGRGRGPRGGGGGGGGGGAGGPRPGR